MDNVCTARDKIRFSLGRPMGVACKQLLPRSERVIAFMASKIRMFVTSCYRIRLLFRLSVGRQVLD